jgi:hypothetical protein
MDAKGQLLLARAANRIAVGNDGLSDCGIARGDDAKTESDAALEK